MKHTFIAHILCCYICTNVLGQGLGTSPTTGGMTPMDADLAIKLINKSWSPELKPSQIDGTPFLFDEWRPGAMIDNSSNLINRIDLLFDIYHHELLLRKRHGKDTLAINKKLIRSFKIYGTDSVYHFRRLSSKDKNGNLESNDYYSVLDSGRISLLLKPVKILHKTTGGGYDSFTGKEKDRLLTFLEYYILDEDEVVQKLKLTRKSVIKALSDQAGEVSSFINKYKVDVKEPKQLQALFRYYNSL